MDILSFLKERTRLIRQYYEYAALPFSETMRKIESEEAPYIPPYSEDGEPPFVSEWIDASELLEVTGRCCISMLSASLQLYFMTWEQKLGFNCGKEFTSEFKKGGLIGGYRACLSGRVGIDWSCCPADLDIIEQIVLARNRDQHPESITTIRVTHHKKDHKRYPQPFFLSEHESKLFQNAGFPSLFMSPSVHVSRKKLMISITQVECLCEWLEEKILNAKHSPQTL
jgi:hypothetical protein